MRTDVLVIGAGPTGLACAIEAQKAGLKSLFVDKGCLVNSLFHYPAGMLFFTTPELLEIGDIPFTTAHQKPTREEALEYYRNVSEHYRLDIRQYEWVKTVMGEDGISASPPPTAPGVLTTTALARLSSPPATTISPTNSAFPAKICPRFRIIMASRILTTTPTCWSSAARTPRLCVSRSVAVKSTAERNPYQDSLTHLRFG